MRDALVIRTLKQRVAEYGTQRETAKVLGISDAYLSDLIRGNRQANDAVLRKLGLKRAVVEMGA